MQWESSRQSCMALSTAEAELLAYIESSVMGDSLQALLGEVLGLGGVPSVVTYGDSQAAIAIIQQPDGPWRLRSYALRERARLGTWQIYHLEGSKLIADFLTKAIAVKSSWNRFRQFINMSDLGERWGYEASQGSFVHGELCCLPSMAQCGHQGRSDCIFSCSFSY